MKNITALVRNRANAIVSNEKSRSIGTTAKKYGKAAAPALVLLGINLISTSAIYAQGPIFTGDSANLSNIIREALKLGAIILFCLGAFFIGWGIYNKGTGKEFGSQAFAGICSFAFGTIVAVFWQIAQGRAVTVDTNF